MGYKKEIKICRVATVPFSILSQLMPQIEYIHNKGMNIFLVSSKGSELDGLRLPDGISYDTIEIPRRLSLKKDFIALIKLIQYFRRHQFDIVHSITPKAGLLVSIAAFLSGIPIRLHTWTGQPWVTRRGPMRWFSRNADRLIGLLNTKCYADSRSQCAFLVKEKIVAPAKINVIGFSSLAGVNLDRFRENILSFDQKKQLRNELHIDENSKVIIFIGRITRDKGIFELNSAFKKILVSGLNAHLILVGPLDEECGGEKTIDIEELISNPKISYVGYSETPEKFLSISDLMCLPSYREGFGTVVIEAAAMCIPTVGTNINGLKDAIEDGETGLMVAPCNADDLYAALKTLLEDEKILKKMGHNSKIRCRALFDSNIINHKVFEEYLSFLDDQKGTKK